jgi:uncharacterized protein (DUF1778 family)
MHFLAAEVSVWQIATRAFKMTQPRHTEVQPMPSATKTTARLNFRLARPLKEVIEEAAAVTGQTVSDFAVSTLVQAARKVVDQRDVTELTNRDRDRFLALIDDTSKKPNKALRDAAERYKKLRGKKP